MKHKNKEYKICYLGLENEVLTELVKDFINHYGFIGMTMRDMTKLFHSWLYWQRRKHEIENNTNITTHKFLYEESHIILEEILNYMYHERIGVFND